MMQVLARLEKSKEFWMIFCSSVVFVFLRIPSLFEPYWYGDEGIYHVLGLGMRHGRLLYRDIWDNKPPLLYLVYGLFNADQFLIRLASLVFGLLTVIVFFLLARQLFGTLKNSILATVPFAIIFGLPLIEGNIANAENFMLLLIILAGFLLVKSEHVFSEAAWQKKGRVFFLAGFLLSLAFLFKVVAIFDTAAVVFFLLFCGVHHNKFVRTLAKQLVFFGVGFGLPILITVAYFTLAGGLMPFLKATLVQNVGYVGYGNTLFIPQGFLFLKLFILGLSVLGIFILRKRLDINAVFVLLWFFFSLFNAYFSQRPYSHYLLVLLPSFCLLFSLCFWKKKYLFLFSFLFIVTVILLQSFWFYSKTLAYYQNFFAFTSGSKSLTAYRQFFDSGTPRDYNIADYLGVYMHPQDTVFVWGNNAQLYALMDRLPPGRFTVAYHMKATPETLLETKRAFEQDKPRFIVITNSADFIPFSLYGYKQRVTLDHALIYERIL